MLFCSCCWLPAALFRSSCRRIVDEEGNNAYRVLSTREPLCAAQAKDKRVCIFYLGDDISRAVARI